MLRVFAVTSAQGAYGGPSETAQRQATLARSAGFEVALVAGSFDSGTAGGADVRVARVRHVLGLNSFIDVFSLAMAALLVRCVRQADLVHISFSREPVPMFAAMLCRLLRVPAVIQPHGMLTSRTSGLHRLIDVLFTRRVVARSWEWIALTTRESEQLAGWDSRLSGRITIVGNPPPLDVRASSTRQGPRPVSPVVLFAARLHPRKRVLKFADAAQIAGDSGWTEQYHVLGPDEGDLPALRERELRVASLTYLGATDAGGVLAKLRDSQVFVLPARDEPWGNVLVSAISGGIPVVVTESCALSALVRDYGAGVVVADDDPVGLAAAVHDILRPENYAKFVGCAQRLGRECFARERVERQLASVYRRSLGVRTKTPPRALEVGK